MILNGEGECVRQIVTVTNREFNARPYYPAPAAKVGVKGSYTVGYAEYDEYVPIVDKAVVDAGWKKEISHQSSFASRGTLPLPEVKNTQDCVRARTFAVLMAFFMALFAFFSSITRRVIKKDSDILQNGDFNISDLSLTSPTPGFTNADLFPSVLKKLCELEEKVYTLEAKPSEMPFEKEELLNAAVCRGDALEAEIFETKKALHEALMRQEDLLAYIDSQEEAKFRRKQKMFCW